MELKVKKLKIKIDLCPQLAATQQSILNIVLNLYLN